MQPTVLPYHGFFQLIKESDVFVFLDNVQFSKQSWQQRNKVLINNKEHWLTVPVKNAHKPLIKDTLISDREEVEKIRKTARKFFKVDLPEATDNLCDLNMSWIKFICNRIGLFPRHVMASDLDKTDIVDICKTLNATEYISTIGSKVYFDDALYNEFRDIGCNVKFNSYEPDYSIVQYLNNKEYLIKRGLGR